MSATGRPSRPGAPPFRLACWSASARVASLAMGPKSPQNRGDLSDFALWEIRRRRSGRLLGAFVLSPLPPVVARTAYRSGSFPPRACCCARIASTPTRSAILVPSQPLPPHGYRPGLCGELSAPDTEDFSSCPLALRSLSPLIPPPVRTVVADSFRPALVAFAPRRPARPPEVRVTRLPLRSLYVAIWSVAPSPFRAGCRRASPGSFRAPAPPVLRGLSLLASVGLAPTG
jgi:hypothetical protein